MSTHLFKAESRRLLKRRFVRYLTLGAVLVLIAIVAGVFLTNQKVGPEQQARAEAAAQAEFQRQVAQAGQARAACEQAKASGASPTERGFPEDCAEIYTPTIEEFPVEWHMASTFDFRENFNDLIIAFAAIMSMAAFVIGASFIGAEWNSGGMMNLLLWRPQRLKVLSTKLGALLTGIAGLTLVLGALWTGAFLATAALRGTTESMTSGAWQSFGLTGLRAFAMILFAAAIGFGLASLGRHTAVALGVGVGLGVVAQFGVYAVLSLAGVKFSEVWLLPTYALAWLNKEVTLTDFDGCNYSGYGGCEPPTMDVTWQTAGAYGLVAAVLVLGAAMWTMRNRDVT